jgi:hypothetical protein
MRRGVIMFTLQLAHIASNNGILHTEKFNRGAIEPEKSNYDLERQQFLMFLLALFLFCLL